MVTMGALMTTWLIISGVWVINDYLKDYWSPQYSVLTDLGPILKEFGLKVGGFEDVLFFFSFSGIAAVLYEEILGETHFRKTRPQRLYFLLIFPAIIFSSFLLIKLLQVTNIIYGEYLGYLLSAVIIWKFRRDLLHQSIIGGLMTGGFFLLFYVFLYIPIFPGIIHKWWVLHQTSGIFVSGVPLEEILWAFFIGLLVGPVYEFLTGLGDRRLPVYSKRRKR